MSYVLGWTLVAAVAGAIVLLLRKVGPPGADSSDERPSGRSCCNAPPESPR